MFGLILLKKSECFGFGNWLDSCFKKLELGYYGSLGKIIYQLFMMVLLLVFVVVVIYQFSECIFNEFILKEDCSNFFIIMQFQEGVSFESNLCSLKQIEDIVMEYCEVGELDWVLVCVFGWGGCVGIVIVGVVFWDQ